MVIVETKLNELDDISNEFDGYIVFNNNRTKCLHASGGVALRVKDSLSKHFHLLKCTNDVYMFFQVDSDLLGKKFLLGVVYIPPENSKYSSIEMFDEIENQVVKLYEEEMAVCI